MTTLAVDSNDDDAMYSSELKLQHVKIASDTRQRPASYRF